MMITPFMGVRFFTLVAVIKLRHFFKDLSFRSLIFTMNQSDFNLDDEEDNALLANHLNEAERVFHFLLTPHLYRRVRRLGVRQRNYVGRLM